MLVYWANAFMTTGAAVLATAFFRYDDMIPGILAGALFIGIGAWFYGLSLPVQRGKK